MNARFYRLTLALRSRLGTPLSADTLWGHVAWAVRYRDGERALTEWLERYEAGDPPLVLTDPMPAGCVPRPRLPARSLPPRRPHDDAFDEQKKRDRTEWLPLTLWRSVAELTSPATVSAAVELAHRDGFELPTLKPETVTHAAINRLTGGTAQEGGGTLFAVDEHFPGDPSPQFDVWLRSPDSADTLRGLFDAALAGGYGRDGGTGAGQLDVVRVEEQPLPDLEPANAGVLLGPAVPSPADAARGFLAFGVRAGRLGGLFSSSPTPSGSDVRQKRAVHCLQRGSVVVGDSLGPVFGRVLKAVHEDPCIRHYGVTLVLRCRLDEALLAEVSA
jgi:CRISPR-associated protein Csm4